MVYTLSFCSLLFFQDKLLFKYTYNIIYIYIFNSPMLLNTLTWSFSYAVWSRVFYLQNSNYVALLSLSRTKNKLRNVKKKWPNHLLMKKHQLRPLYVVFFIYLCIAIQNGIDEFKVVHKIYINTLFEIKIMLSRWLTLVIN